MSGFLQYLQHDSNYEIKDLETYSHNIHSPADFFIRKFDGKTNLGSTQLRHEDEILESKLLSSSLLENVQYRFRDFSRICRGETLVSYKYTITIILSNMHGLDCK